MMYEELKVLFGALSALNAVKFAVKFPHFGLAWFLSSDDPAQRSTGAADATSL
jgi:hypothetical protein